MIAPASSMPRETLPPVQASGRAVTVAAARRLCPEIATWPDAKIMVLLDGFYELAPLAAALAQRTPDQPLEVIR